MKRDAATAAGCGSAAAAEPSPAKQQKQTAGEEGSKSAYEGSKLQANEVMRLHVLFFATARVATGGIKELDDFSIATGSTTDDFIQAIVQRFPRLGAVMKSAAIAVNQEYAEPAQPLTVGSRVVRPL